VRTYLTELLVLKLNFKHPPWFKRRVRRRERR
jgi:hypothetical protein